MRLSKVILSIFLATMVTPLVPTSAGDTADTFMVDFDGQTYLEYEQFVERFDRLQFTDVDADGLLEPPVYAFSTVDWTNLTTAVSNEQIQEAAMSLGYSEAEMVDQIDLFFSFYPDWSSNATAAIAAVQVGDFSGAKTSLTGTPADIQFYCDGRTVRWTMVIPYPFDCHANSLIGSSIPELYIAVEILSVQVNSGADVEKIDLIVRSVSSGLASNTHKMWLGAGYQPAVKTSTLGVWEKGRETSVGFFGYHSRLLNELNADVDFKGLTGPTFSGTVSAHIELERGDRIAYSKGAFLSSTATSFRAPLQLAANSFDLTWEYKGHGVGGYDLDFDFTTGSSHLEYFEMRVPDSEEGKNDRTEVRVSEFKPQFLLRSRQFLDSDKPKYGDKEDFRIFSDYSLYNAEAEVSKYTGNLLKQSMAFRGFPKWFEFRQDNDEDPNNRYKSIDIHPLKENVGYFRAAAIKSHNGGKIPATNLMDIGRAVFYYGSPDIWQETDEYVVGISGNLARCDPTETEPGTDGSGGVAKWKNIPLVGTARILMFPGQCQGNDPSGIGYLGTLGSYTIPAIIYDAEGLGEDITIVSGANLYHYAYSDNALDERTICFKKEDTYGCP